MDCLLCYEMLKEGELEVLSVLDEPTAISALADTLDRSGSYVSRLVSSLEEKGLVERRREGRRKLVRPIANEPVNHYRNVTRRYPHVDFPELLQGKAISILYYLDEPITVSELAEETGDYRNTVNRIVKRFQNRGIVKKHEGTYVLNEDFEELNEFARSLVTHLHIVDAPVSGTIIWEAIDEFLLQTTAEIDEDRYFLTGPQRFAEYDLPLLTTSQVHYFYSERIDELAAADVVCHMLLIDDSARFKGYCLLLITKENIEEEQLRDRAGHYGLTETVDELVEYLATKGAEARPDIVSWSRFQELATQYEVDV